MRYTTAHSSRHSKQRGFTLIEVLVISPLVVLLIGTMVYSLTTLTGESLMLREKNALSYTTQTALDEIETSVAFATGFPTTSGSTFNAGNNALIIKSPATTTNPFGSGKQLIYRSSDGDCSTTESSNPLLEVTYVFYLNNGSLWKRTQPLPECSTGTQPWQKQSCATAANCNPNRKDEEFAENITSMTIAYYKNPTSTNPIQPTDLAANPPNTVKVTLAAKKHAAGEEVSYSNSMTATSLNALFSSGGN